MAFAINCIAEDGKNWNQMAPTSEPINRIVIQMQNKCDNFFLGDNNVACAHVSTCDGVITDRAAIEETIFRVYDFEYVCMRRLRTLFCIFI